MTQSDRIGLGDTVGNFVLTDQEGGEFDLSEYRGQKVLLSFHPLAWTSVCAQQMTALDSRYNEFRSLGTTPVGISVDTVPSKKAWAESLGLQDLRLLSDFWPHGELARRLEIFIEPKGISERSNILLDEKQEVIFVEVYEISKVPDFQEIIDTLEEVV